MLSSLSLLLYRETFFLLGRDQNQKVAYVHQGSYDTEKNLISSLKDDQVFKLDLTTEVFSHDRVFTLVPGVLYDQAFAAAYLLLAGPINNQTKVFETSLESNNVILLGSMSQGLHEFLSLGKSEISFHHGSASFLGYALKEKFNLLPEELLISFFDQSFYLAAFKKQELVLFNRFDTDNEEESLRYIFGVIHQLGFETKHCRISVFADESSHITSDWGKNHFHNIRIFEPVSNQHFLKGTEKLQKSRIFESFWKFQ